MALPVWCVPQGQHPLLRPAVLRRPSVVNIANIALARHYYSTDVLKIPQGVFWLQLVSGVAGWAAWHGILNCVACIPAATLNCSLCCCCLAGQGSGFIWDTAGHIVTNFHVIRGASEVQVSLIDQSTYPAKVVGGERDLLRLPRAMPALNKRGEDPATFLCGPAAKDVVVLPMQMPAAAITFLLLSCRRPRQGRGGAAAGGSPRGVSQPEACHPGRQLQPGGGPEGEALCAEAVRAARVCSQIAEQQSKRQCVAGWSGVGSTCVSHAPPPTLVLPARPLFLPRQKVFAIGNPFGLDHSLSSGIISGLNRELNTGGLAGR